MTRNVATFLSRGEVQVIIINCSDDETGNYWNDIPRLPLQHSILFVVKSKKKVDTLVSCSNCTRKRVFLCVWNN